MIGRIKLNYGRTNKGVNGFSLTELIVVIAIISILLAIATLNFNAWVTKSSIERETRELFADLNSARIKAMYGKQRYTIAVNPLNYSLSNYSSDNELQSAGKQLFNKTVKYSLSGSAVNTPLVFDSRGILNSGFGGTIYVSYPANTGAAFDCIVLDDIRINLGKTAYGPQACNQR